jgi:hypothetical protein
MLFTNRDLEGISSGRITVAFRKWTRPTVKAGGTLVAAAGLLAIETVDPVQPGAITDGDARRAGRESADVVRAELRARREGTCYRIRFHIAGPDPRIALRARGNPGRSELQAILARLDRLDRASSHGARRSTRSPGDPAWSRRHWQRRSAASAIDSRSTYES